MAARTACMSCSSTTRRRRGRRAVERAGPTSPWSGATRTAGSPAGCNLGLADLDEVDTSRSSTTTSPWTATGSLPSSTESSDDQRVGAACPKILFATPFVEIEIEVPATRRGRGDGRLLGTRVSGARVGGVDVIDETQLVHGFWGPEPAAGDDPRAPSQWTRDRARLRCPSSPANRRPRSSSCSRASRLALPRSAAAIRSCAVSLGPRPTWCRVPEGAAPLDVVNSAGAMLTADGYGADRGYLEPDDGRFDEPTDVFAWSGATVLLSAPYLRDVGVLDERLFLYYEDLELSWRGQARGWRYRYTPESVVRHVHSATIGEHSRLARYQNERNRLLVLARHGDARDARRAADALTARYGLVRATRHCESDAPGNTAARDDRRRPRAGFRGLFAPPTCDAARPAC